MDLQNLLSPVAQNIEPYVPGEQPKIPGLIKLNTNENPYPPSPLAMEAGRRELDASLRLYPDPESTALRNAIARHHDVKIENVFVGNGSDEVLALCFPAFFQQKGTLLFPDITYSFYKVFAALFDVPYKAIALNEDFTVDVDAFASPCAGVLLPNPNAPTALLLEEDNLIRIIGQCAQSVVVLDEAYAEFSQYSAVPLITRCPQVLIVRTLSKSHSLAGLRVGYAIGGETLIEGLCRVKNAFNSYPLDRVAQAAAQAAIEDTSTLALNTQRVLRTRERVKISLNRLGFEVLPSRANFIFCRHAKIPGAEIMQALRARNILVRRFDAPRIKDYLRITVGTDTEMDALLGALQNIIFA